MKSEMFVEGINNENFTTFNHTAADLHALNFLLQYQKVQ